MKTAENLLPILIAVALSLGTFTGAMLQENTIHKQATQTSCAQYSPTTGEFEWIKKARLTPQPEPKEVKK
mgnify:FL=1|tara:strand:- start:495 stop:704 length:210 start_codon:yes stop_codon:yes gene_type:complete